MLLRSTVVHGSLVRQPPLIKLATRDLYVALRVEQVTFVIPEELDIEHPTDTPKNGKRRLNSPRPCRGEWRSPVGEFKEPILAPAFAKLLALRDVVADDLDTAMNELTEQLRKQTQEEVVEVGDVVEVDKLLACV